MLKLVAASVLGCCGLVCCANDALACNGGCCSMNMDMSAPTPGMPGMPEMPAAPQANAGSQYRTYSYQPAPTRYRSYGRSPASGFRDATFKAQGRY